MIQARESKSTPSQSKIAITMPEGDDQMLALREGAFSVQMAANFLCHSSFAAHPGKP